MSRNEPRRFVESSMSGPMYAAGVITDRVTHGSSIASISPAGGMRAGLSTTIEALLAEPLHAVLDGRRRGDEVQVELALQALLDDLHVEEAQEAAAEAEARARSSSPARR